MRKITTNKLTHMAVFIAIQIILSRFLSINAPSLRIGFAFVPIAVCAYLYGPGWTVLVGVTADIIGSAFLSTGWYPPITITMALSSLTFGLLLYRRRNPRALHTTAAAVIDNLVLSLFLQTYWLTLLLGKGYMVLLPGRVFQAFVVCGVQCVLLPLIIKMSERLARYFNIGDA